MRRPLAAMACAIALVSTCTVEAAAPLTLHDALRRVSDAHPDLRLIDARAGALDAARDTAALAPATTLEATLENLAGSGETRGLHGAELTLGIASVFERGGKREARIALAGSRLDALATERQARRLDLLADVARRYLDAASARWRGDVAEQDAQQRGKARDAARRRFTAGAAPESAALAAEAALARAELAQARARLGERHAFAYLAALWGRQGDGGEAPAAKEPAALPALEPPEALLARLERNPELTKLADARRIADARLRLAETDARADLSWQVGVRRMQASQDMALVAGLSVPLGNARRAAPSIREATLERDALDIERESIALALRITLIEAVGRYELAREEVRRLDADVLPRLHTAAAAAERAYRAGAGDYLDWGQLQSEAIDARFQRVDAAAAGLAALIEIQRLAGLPIRFADARETAAVRAVGFGLGTGREPEHPPFRHPSESRDPCCFLGGKIKMDPSFRWDDGEGNLSRDVLGDTQ